MLKIRNKDKINLKMDATYFEQFCLICYQDNFDGYPSLIRFSDGELFEEMKEDLSNLIKKTRRP